MPIHVFAEGMTTNGTVLCPFKEGAFVSELKCKPLALIYDDASISHAFDTIGMLPLIILLCCSWYSKVTVLTLPDFEPNEYLFETHADKG